MTAAALAGHCLCGAVTVSVTGRHDPRPAACHCRMCQRWSGGLFLGFEAEAKGVTVEGPVTRYASSDFAERAFCTVCGSHIWFRDTGSETIEVMPGLFDAARTWPLRSEVYCDRAMAAIGLQGDHRRATQADYEEKNRFVPGDVP